MVKNYFTLFFIILFFTVQACSSILVVDNKQMQAIRKYIQTSCPINNKIDTSKDVILATLYFDLNQTTISQEQKDIIDKVVSIFNACNNKILIIGHSSNLEKNNSQLLSYRLSYDRAKVVYDYLNKKIPSNQIYYIFCDSSRNKYIENNSIASYGNQRVEIIMLANSFMSNYSICLGNK